MKLFNANSATLLKSLKLGAAGFSGVMANFQPCHYVWLTHHWREQPEAAERLIRFLSMTALIEKQLYPVNAKYFLMLEGVLSNYRSRAKNHAEFTETNRLEVEQLRAISREFPDKGSRLL